MPGTRPLKTTQRLSLDAGSPGTDGVNDDSVEGEEVWRVGGPGENSLEGEDGGGGEDGGRGEDGGTRCEELGLKGILAKCASSTALSSARNSSL